MQESRNSDETNSHHNIDDNGKSKERKLNEFSSAFPAVMYNVDGPNISLIEIVNIVPRKGQIPVSFKSEAKFDDRFTANLQFIFNAV